MGPFGGQDTFGLVCFLAVLSLERLPSVQQQGTDVNELLGPHEEDDFMVCDRMLHSAC